ncbi:MAG: gamma-glutamyl-gamma-aminobutyrate hydrolase family protein [Myxococcota bacterium]
MSNSKAPVVGITTVQTSINSGDFHKPVVLVNQAYVNLVADFGAIPVLVTENEAIVERLDALLIIGGQDMDPAFWHAKQEVDYQAIPGVGKRFCRPLDYAPNRKRDQFELALYQAAKSKKIPIFGICRGLQLINIAEGGTLHQELPESNIQHETGPDGTTQCHFINIDPNSYAHELMQVTSYTMSSRHHQGIDRLAKNLKATAWSEDGLIEMIEQVDSENWMMAVQGHIETTRVNFPLYDRLMEAFIERARLTH